MRTRNLAALAMSFNMFAFESAFAQTEPTAQNEQLEQTPPAAAEPPAATQPDKPAPRAPAAKFEELQGVELPPVIVKQPEPEPDASTKPAKPETAKAVPPKPQPIVPVTIKKKPPATKPESKPKPAQKPVAAPPPADLEPVANDVSSTASETLQTQSPGLPPDATPLSLDESYGAMVPVGSNDFAANPGATFTNALENKPGIASSSFAPGSSRPVVRGLDNTRVPIQEGGSGVGDVSDLSEDHAVPVDPCSITSAGVIRGPAALRTTSKAAGGVVNTETNRIPATIPEGGLSGEVRGGLSSVDDGRDGCFNATAGANGIAVHSGAFVRRASDYDTPLGLQENSFVDSQGYSAGASFIGLNGFIGLSFARFESVYGIPGVEASEEQVRIDLEQDRLSAKGELRLEDAVVERLRFWYSYSDYAHREIVFADGPDAVGARFLNDEHEGRFEAEHAPFASAIGEVRGAAGIQISHRDLAGLSTGGDNLIEPGTTEKIAAYLFEEARFSARLKLLASLRWERVDAEGRTVENIASPRLADFSKTFDTASGGIGAVYDLNADVSIRFSGLHLERAPETPELFSKGAHEATGTFEIGNPNLETETAHTVELGLAKNKGAYRFDLTGYYTRFDGFIVRQLTGETCGETLDSCTPAGNEDELDQAIFVQRDARFIGAELSGEYDVAQVWNGVWGISGQYDFVRARFEDGENVARIPPHRLGGGIYYRDKVWNMHVSLLHAFDQDRIGFGETSTDGYTLLSAAISATIVPGDTGGWPREYVIGLSGANLLDEEVRHHTSFKKDEVLQPGIGVKLFGIARF